MASVSQEQRAELAPVWHRLLPRDTAQVHALAAWLVVGVLGAIEGLYGRTRYFGDWISYLNVSRALAARDWKLFFDPMWTPGYPALVSLARAFFPHTADGEWYAIATLNWLIFIGAYAALRHLLQQTVAFYGAPAGSLRSPVHTWAVTALFLGSELSLDTVSRVTPDLLVAVLFVLAAAQVLQIARAPTTVHAATLGVILGLGFCVKGIFLSYSAIFFLVFALLLHQRRIGWRPAAVSAAGCLLLAVPFIAAISWAYGALTFGVTGQLNYAFHVNGLPHWTHWQGDAQFGMPRHPSQHLLQDLPAFGFAEPFHTTYPPHNNLAYWYQGFHGFFSFRNQLAAIVHNCYVLVTIVMAHPLIKVLLVLLLVIALWRSWREAAVRTCVRLWPLLLSCALGLATYLLVHIEDHYLAPLMLVAGLLPLALALDPRLEARKAYMGVLLAAYLIAGGAELRAYVRPALSAALRHSDFHQDEQWRLAAALGAYGLRPGDPVAVIGGDDETYRCTWAYVARLRIIAEFGSLPWRRAPFDRTPVDGAGPEEADKNAGQVFWQLPPQDRQRVLDAFRQTGARVALSLFRPVVSSEAGWHRLGDTGAWIYRF